MPQPLVLPCSFTVTTDDGSFTADCSVTVTTPKSYFTFVSATGTIEDYNTAGGLDVVIPSAIDGVTVTTIGDSAFYNNQLTSVTIGANVAIYDESTTMGTNPGFQTVYDTGGKLANL